jgi:hypothetical protein
MKNEWKAVTIVSAACGLAIVNAAYSVDVCERGEWCRDMPIDLSDGPHRHPAPTQPGKIMLASRTSASHATNYYTSNFIITK